MSEAIETTATPGLGALAQLVNCLDEHGFATLAGVKLSTLNAWRKRGQGPSHVRLGTNYFYPIAAVQAYIADKLELRSGVDARSLLI